MKLHQEIHGWMFGEELVVIGKLAEAAKPKWGLEIGCWQGLATVHLAQLCQHHLWAVDPFSGSQEHQQFLVCQPSGWLRARYDENLRRCGVAAKVTTLAMLSAQALPLLAEQDRHFSLALVDGSHAFPDVVADLEGVVPLMDPGGLLFIDDINWPEVQLALYHCKLKADTHPVTAKLGLVRI